MEFAACKSLLENWMDLDDGSWWCILMMFTLAKHQFQRDDLTQQIKALPSFASSVLQRRCYLLAGRGAFCPQHPLENRMEGVRHLKNMAEQNTRFILTEGDSNDWCMTHIRIIRSLWGLGQCFDPCSIYVVSVETVWWILWWQYRKILLSRSSGRIFSKMDMFQPADVDCTIPAKFPNFCMADQKSLTFVFVFYPDSGSPINIERDRDWKINEKYRAGVKLKHSRHYFAGTWLFYSFRVCIYATHLGDH